MQLCFYITLSDRAWVLLRRLAIHDFRVSLTASGYMRLSAPSTFYQTTWLT